MSSSADSARYYATHRDEVLARQAERYQRKKAVVVDLVVLVIEREPEQRFIRRCLQHGLELDGLKCPEGHTAKVLLWKTHEVLAWEVWDTLLNRPVVQVIGAHVRWEHWFEIAVDKFLPLLQGRSRDGMTHGPRRIRHASA
jgi:hypothetical protein